jgi:LysR family transcriptional regulator, pca operon transcriptional activator
MHWPGLSSPFLGNKNGRMIRSAGAPPGPQLGRRLKLNQLRAVGTIVEVGSIAEAARRLGVSQSATSKMLREIEEELGLTLFIRHPKGVEVTSAGHRVAESARRIALEMDTLQDELEQMAGRKTAGVALGALPTAASGVVSGMLARFKAYRPNASVQIVQGRSDDLLPRLSAGDLDLVIGRLYQPAAPDGLVREALYDETIAVLARTDHPLFEEPRLSPEHLKRFDFVLPTISQRLGMEIEAVIAALGLPSDRALRTSSPEVLREMLYTGNYLTVVPRLMMAGDLDRGALRILPLAFSGSKRPAGVIHRGRATLGPDARALVRALRAHIAASAELETP